MDKYYLRSTTKLTDSSQESNLPLNPSVEGESAETDKVSLSMTSESSPQTVPIIMTNEQLQDLIANMTQAFVQAQAPPPSSTGNFSNCASRFSGNKDEDVEAFINAITVYKDCVNVSNGNAVKGLPMLLDNHAATWWQGIQSTISTWDEALLALRHSYGLNMPSYKIFKELFSREQKDREPTDIFVNACRALIARLPKPPELHIIHQLDMVYALLNRRIKHRLPRDQVQTFSELIDKARAIEDTFDDQTKEKKHNTGNPAGNSSGNNDNKPRSRPKCQFCQNFGHTQEICRKFAASQASGQQNLPRGNASQN